MGRFLTDNDVYQVQVGTKVGIYTYVFIEKFFIKQKCEFHALGTVMGSPEQMAGNHATVLMRIDTIVQACEFFNEASGFYPGAPRRFLANSLYWLDNGGGTGRQFDPPEGMLFAPPDWQQPKL